MSERLLREGFGGKGWKEGRWRAIGSHIAAGPFIAATLMRPTKARLRITTPRKDSYGGREKMKQGGERRGTHREQKECETEKKINEE